MKHILQFLVITFLLFGCHRKVSSTFQKSSIPDFDSEYKMTHTTIIQKVHKPRYKIDSFSQSTILPRIFFETDTLKKNKAKVNYTRKKQKKVIFKN